MLAHFGKCVSLIVLSVNVVDKSHNKLAISAQQTLNGISEEPEQETLLRDLSPTPKIRERRMSQPAEHVYHYEHVKELFLEPDLIAPVDPDPNKKPDDDEKLIDWSKGRQTFLC